MDSPITPKASTMTTASRLQAIEQAPMQISDGMAG
jgi:hypothetical protein